MTQSIETLIIGRGRQGRATCFYLPQRGREHVVLEQATQAGNVWRNDRWDSLSAKMSWSKSKCRANVVYTPL